jgi:hypothetical protein
MHRGGNGGAACKRELIQGGPVTWCDPSAFRSNPGLLFLSVPDVSCRFRTSYGPIADRNVRHGGGSDDERESGRSVAGEIGGVAADDLPSAPAEADAVSRRVQGRPARRCRGVAVGDRAGAGAAQLTVGDRNLRPDDPEPAEVFMLGVATAVRAALRQWRRLLPIRLRGPVRWPWRPWASPRRRPGRAGSSFGSPLENGAA